MVMSRWDPWSEALTLRDAMNRLFEQAVLQPWNSEGQRGDQMGFSPPLDVHETSDDYTIKASLPGVKPEDVNIQLERGTLTISGEVNEEHEQPSGDGQRDSEKRQSRFHMRERRMGRFHRSITLPENVNADKAQATFEHGVLTLKIPKAEETKPRRIEIQGGRTQQTGAREIPASASQGNGQTKQPQTATTGQGSSRSNGS